MKIAIQIILIAVVFAIIFIVLSNRTTHSGRAWKKISLVLLAFLMIAAIIFPESTNLIANLVGVGRGADLLLYGLAVAFILYALNNYLSYQAQRDGTYRLARKIAIIEAREKYKSLLSK